MKILSKAEIVTAEKVLLKHLPRSFKVYGYLRAINKDRPTVVEVLVDSWPEFKVIICRSKCENESVGKTRKKVSYYCTDENALRKMLVDADVIDWSTYFIIGDSHHLLPEQEVPSQVASRISSLDLSHVDLVNKTWKFGGDEKGYSSITNLITNFPSCCITDEHGQPVSWILLYDYCAMGLLYTLPEHRGKGHAKVLISTMARRLIAEGFPVYCFIEEDNTLSYKAFTNLGFIEDPTYRAAWLEFNF
ncbi:Glycine N-acyltransferase-like protein 3 [Takifugu flavidus]|uniref:Glycine N-acyltransferase-like protein n=1 Tax=Takifugu flavidus TaxID=433684 RepID=A0A5C6PK33_9TELE|nr:Glycine N-acyltransferase-like protein 3 [Takifugu flavidus]